MTDRTQRARTLGLALVLGVFGSALFGCAGPPKPIAYDAYGYPVDYAVSVQDRFGVCAKHRHLDCHAHHLHYLDQHGDQQIYLWEHPHYRQSKPGDPQVTHQPAPDAPVTTHAAPGDHGPSAQKSPGP